MDYFAFYGTLRKGDYNYDRFGGDETMRVTGQAMVPGYKMLDLGPYPAIIRDPGSEIKVDLVEVRYPEVAEALRGMELGAGYSAEFVEHGGQKYEIFVGSPALARYVGTIPTVTDGDWLTYKYLRDPQP